MSQSKQYNFAVTGNPVSHSKSPDVFTDVIGKQYDDLYYTRILLDDINDIHRLKTAFDLVAINITAPFKESAFGLAQKLSDEAKITKAINTLIFKDLNGYNTDVSALQKIIKDNVPNSTSLNALVIGTGGASRAAITALKYLAETNIYISSRDELKSKKVISEFDIKLHSYINHYDLIINTSPHLPEIISSLKMMENAVVIDANYNKKPCAEFASINNLKYITGEEWLLYQGIAAYKFMLPNRKIIENINIELLKKSKNTPSRIALIGMMGSGKSTIGKSLAQKLSYSFIDMDKMIEESENMSITDIFQLHGESYFRDIESKLLHGAILSEKTIISTGGGIVLSEENINLLKKNCWNICLYAEPELIATLIKENKRPLLIGKDTKSEIKRIFTERKDMYFRSADVIVCSDKKPYLQIADSIYEDFCNSFLSQR